MNHCPKIGLLQKKWRAHVILSVVIFTMICSVPALARDVNDNRAYPTLFAYVEGGFTTYKSEMLASNDTGTSVGYTLGFHAGEERNIGVLFKNQSTTVAFALNKSKITTTWQDTVIRYRFGAFYLGVVLGAATLKAKGGEYESSNPSVPGTAEEELDVIGTGYGGNAGWNLRCARSTAWYFDTTSVTISSARDLNQVDVKYGSRLDIDTGVAFYLTREFLDLNLGYRMQTYTFSVEDSYSESANTTYLALRFNSFF